MYQGETSRTGFTRIGTHFTQYRKETAKAKEDSWMWVHTLEKHGGERGPEEGTLDYSPKILRSFPYPLERQQDEGLRIKEDLQDPSMDSLNREEEYYKPEFLRFVWSK